MKITTFASAKSIDVRIITSNIGLIGIPSFTNGGGNGLAVNQLYTIIRVAAMAYACIAVPYRELYY